MAFDVAGVRPTSLALNLDQVVSAGDGPAMADAIVTAPARPGLAEAEGVPADDSSRSVTRPQGNHGLDRRCLRARASTPVRPERDAYPIHVVAHGVARAGLPTIPRYWPRRSQLADCLVDGILGRPCRDDEHYRVGESGDRVRVGSSPEHWRAVDDR